MLKIISGMELLRDEPRAFIRALEWPIEANVMLHLRNKEATIICQLGLVYKHMWAFDTSKNLVGWNLWEHTSFSNDKLKYKHCITPGSTWVYFANTDQTFSTPQALAKEFVFHLEVWVGQAE